MTLEETRTRCIRTGRIRQALVLTPLLIVGALIAAGLWPWAVLVFISSFLSLTIGTLVPRCTWLGTMIKRQSSGSTQPLLTIDDGPHPEHTPAILDILDRHGIKAIFFLIGERAAQHPQLVLEIIRRGHEIANHTQTHPATSFWTLRPVRMWYEIATCQQTLTQIAPQHAPRYFRPPAGHHNLFCALTARALGLEMMMWTARGFDGSLRDVSAILERIRRKLSPDGIVLIHEGTPVAIEVTEKVAALLQTFTSQPLR